MSDIITGERGDELTGAWIYDYSGLCIAGRWSEMWLELREYRSLSSVSIPRLIKNKLIKPWLRSLFTAEWFQDVENVRDGNAGKTEQSDVSIPPWINPAFARRVNLLQLIRNCYPKAPPLADDARRQRYGLVFSANSARRIRLEERVCARFGLGYFDPWSDIRIARFILAIPQWRIHSLRRYKHLVKGSLRGIMPEKARQNCGKTEPNALYERGVLGRARDTIEDLTTDTHAAGLGFVNEAALRQHYDSILVGESQRFDFWWPLTLEMWLRSH
jgi:hypothetical protein